MGENELFTRFVLVPVAADLPEIRQLIESVIADDAREQRATEAFVLFSVRIASDAFLIYRAMTSSFDTASLYRLELLSEAGLEPAKAFLRESSEPEARELLALFGDSSLLTMNPWRESCASDLERIRHRDALLAQS
jgi:hypothetical protein